jgi:hypothetical protein
MCGHEPDQGLVTRRPDDRPQREMDLVVRNRDKRTLDRGKAAGRVEELLDSLLVQDENLGQARDSRIGSPI